MEAEDSQLEALAVVADVVEPLAASVPLAPAVDQTQKPVAYPYFTVGMEGRPISLICEDEVKAEPVSLKFVSASKNCELKVSELSRILQEKFNITSKGRNRAYVYFLKYRHLEPHDMAALEVLRRQSMAGDACFVFVDSKVKNMHKPIAKLAKGILPPNVVVLPWETQMTEATRRAIVGLAVSLIAEDHTLSLKAVTRARVPVRPLSSS